MSAHPDGTRQSSDGGFTLIELLVVVIIIGILAAIAIPVYMNQRNKGWNSQAQSDARNLADNEEAYVVDHDVYLDFDSTTPSSVPDFSGYRDSDRVVTKAKANGALGYCIISESRSGLYFVYDSQNGGLNKVGFTSLPTTANFPAGTACGTSVPTLP